MSRRGVDKFMKKKFLVILLAVICVSMFMAPSVLAASKITDYGGPLETVVKGTGGLEQNASLPATIGKVIKGALSIVGLVFFALMFYAGYTWMIARGEEEKITTARNTIIAAMIGIIIVVGSYALTNIIVGRLINGTPAGPGKPTKDDPLGCCLDRVKPCTDDAMTNAILVPMWAWRITTKSDCIKQGENPDPKKKDCYYGKGDGYVRFTEGEDVEACQKLYKAA